MAFNLGNYLNDNVFNQRQFKDVTNTIGNYGGKILNFGSTMATNMLKLSTNISNWMGSSYFPYIILGIGGVIVLFKLKVI